MTSCLRTMIVTSYLFSFYWPYLADPTAVYVIIFYLFNLFGYERNFNVYKVE